MKEQEGFSLYRISYQSFSGVITGNAVLVKEQYSGRGYSALIRLHNDRIHTGEFLRAR